MAAAERRPGRRDNGLDATDWRAIDDLDPRVAEDVLDALATRGIAAYVQPAVDVDPVTRSATLPSRPAERLYVDRRRVEPARELLRGLLGDRPADDVPRAGHPPAAHPGAERSPVGRAEPDPPDHREGDGGAPGSDRQPPDAVDVDATFAGIVAGFEQTADRTAAGWPAVEDLEPDRDRERDPEPDPGVARPPAAPPHRPGPVDARDVTEPSLLDALDSFGADLPDEDPPERFVPPPPPPLPRLSRQTVLGWVAIVVGLLLLLGRPNVLPVERSTTMLLGFASILGGAVALILRLRPGSEPDDSHPDDGARV